MVLRRVPRTDEYIEYQDDESPGFRLIVAFDLDSAEWVYDLTLYRDGMAHSSRTSSPNAIAEEELMDRIFKPLKATIKAYLDRRGGM